MIKDVFINFVVTTETDERARLAAAYQKCTRSELVRRALDAYLDGLGLPRVVSRKTEGVSHERQTA